MLFSSRLENFPSQIVRLIIVHQITNCASNCRDNLCHRFDAAETTSDSTWVDGVTANFPSQIVRLIVRHWGH